MPLYHSSLEYADKMSYSETGAGWEDFKRTLKEKTAAVHHAFPGGRSDLPASVQYELALNRELKSDAAVVFNRAGIPHPLRNLPMRLLYLWSPNDFYSGWVHGMARIEHFVFMTSVVIGIWLLRTNRRLYILLFPALYVTAVHFVFGAEGRYSIPARPGLMPIAAYALFHSIGRIKMPRRSGVRVRAAADAALKNM
jgi:hypothetical protein